MRSPIRHPDGIFYIYNLHHRRVHIPGIFALNALQIVNPGAAATADLQLADCRRAGRWCLEGQGYGLIGLGAELAAFVGGGKCRVVTGDAERGGLGIHVLEVDGRASGSLRRN
jgi:hypothetical protein